MGSVRHAVKRRVSKERAAREGGGLKPRRASEAGRGVLVQRFPNPQGCCYEPHGTLSGAVWDLEGAFMG